MAAEQEYATHIVDLLEGFGHCEARRMFCGYGIFRQGSMFGLSADGGSAFSCSGKESEYRLSGYQPADEFFEADNACRRRARLAFDAALRNPPKRKRSKS